LEKTNYQHFTSCTTLHLLIEFFSAQMKTAVTYTLSKHINFQREQQESICASIKFSFLVVDIMQSEQQVLALPKNHKGGPSVLASVYKNQETAI
jgi:hypothetical protein